MEREQYFVVLKDGKWMITFNGRHFGPYDTQKLAYGAAVDAAHETGKRGLNAQVLIQGENNQFRTEWTYGDDPYPPKG